MDLGRRAEVRLEVGVRPGDARIDLAVAHRLIRRGWPPAGLKSSYFKERFAGSGCRSVPKLHVTFMTKYVHVCGVVEAML